VEERVLNLEALQDLRDLTSLLRRST
jgi:hypothetical protein